MTQAMNFYNDVKDKLGEETSVTPVITKRGFIEDGWEYTFFFYKGELAKIEAWNHRELIEIYNK